MKVKKNQLDWNKSRELGKTQLVRKTSGWGFALRTNLLLKDKSEKMAWGRESLKMGWSVRFSIIWA